MSNFLSKSGPALTPVDRESAAVGREGCEPMGSHLEALAAAFEFRSILSSPGKRGFIPGSPKDEEAG